MRCPSILHALTPSLLALSLLAGCVGAAHEEEAGVAAEAIESLPAVTVYDSGTWDSTTDCGYNGVTYQCFYVGRFWIDLSVKNLGYNKTVGVVWTDDDWATQHTSYAGYEGGLDFGREKWGVEATFHGGYQPSYNHTVKYAVFATQNGQTSWDPLNNHVINSGELDLAQPIQVLSTGFSYDPARGGTVMDGVVRVVNLAYDKQVTVRVTKDGWRSYADVDATWQSGNDFAFSAPNLGTVPERVEYAVRYRVAGVELWDDNHGQNYTYDVAPRFYEPTYYSLTSGATNLSGNYQAYVWAGGALPVSGLSCRLDGAPLTTCDTYSWGSGGSAYASLSTAGLTDGAHQIEITASVAGGYQTSHTIPFTVQNRVTVDGGWAPGAEASPVSLARDSGNRIYVLHADGSVTRHDTPGAAGTLLVAADPQTSGAYHRQITVDDQGRLHVLREGDSGAVIRRYLSDGSADTTFGNAGTAALGSISYCVDEIGLAGGNVYAVDHCQGVIAGLDASGGALPGTPIDSTIFYGGFCGDGQSLWLVGDAVIERYQPSAGGLVQVSTTAAGQATYSPSLACTGGALTAHYDSRVFTIDSAGGFTELWHTGGYGTHDFPGRLDYGSPLARLDDGSILGLHNGKIDRLTPTP